MSEDSTDTHNYGGSGDRLTIAEAATLLGVHENTVRNRIEDGTYKAEEVSTEHGQRYLIERKSLLANSTTNAPSSDSQQLVGSAPTEFVQETYRPLFNELGDVRGELGDVREELGAERVRRQMAEERAATLEVELEALREARDEPMTLSTKPERAEPAEPVAHTQREESTAVKQLPLGGYIGGILLTGIMWMFMEWGVFIVRDVFDLQLKATLPTLTIPLILGLLVSIAFGYLVGRFPRNANLVRHVLVTGLLLFLVGLVLLLFVAPLIVRPFDSFTYLVFLGHMSIVIISFVSSSAIGNARRQRVAMRLAGGTLVTAGASERWGHSPLTLTLLGVAGNIIAAVITAATAIAIGT